MMQADLAGQRTCRPSRVDKMTRIDRDHDALKGQQRVFIDLFSICHMA